MKRLLIVCAAVSACACAWADLEGQPVYKMTEAQLVEVAKNGALDDRMTACQELPWA